MNVSCFCAVIRATRAAVLALVFAGVTSPVTAADMNKVIRHVFPAGEEGFDPAAAHDLYSGTVEQEIFERLISLVTVLRKKLVNSCRELGRAAGHEIRESSRLEALYSAHDRNRIRSPKRVQPGEDLVIHHPE